MTKAAFEKIKAGLGEARAYLDKSAEKSGYAIHVPSPMDEKKIRTQRAKSA